MNDRECKLVCMRLSLFLGDFEHYNKHVHIIDYIFYVNVLVILYAVVNIYVNIYI